MSSRRITPFIALSLVSCGGPASTSQPLPRVELPARTAAEARLEALLDTCVDSARQGTSPRAAEALAEQVHARWRRTRSGLSQFHAQAQSLGDGRIQFQVQVQLVEAAQSAQAQRQVLLPATVTNRQGAGR